MLAISVPVRHIAVGALVLAALPVASASAQRLMTRAELAALLGAASVTEGFERFTVPSGSTFNGAPPVLDATTNIPSQGGANLVAPGIRFSVLDGPNLQINGPQYFGMTSISLVGNATSTGRLAIDFLSPVQAFGLNANNFAGYASNASILVYREATLLGSFDIPLPGAPAFSFAGWRDATGITRVELVNLGVQSQGQFWTPIVDDVTFGQFSTVPEPATVALVGVGLLGLGAVARRRRG